VIQKLYSFSTTDKTPQSALLRRSMNDSGRSSSISCPITSKLYGKHNIVDAKGTHTPLP